MFSSTFIFHFTLISLTIFDKASQNLIFSDAVKYMKKPMEKISDGKMPNKLELLQKFPFLRQILVKVVCEENNSSSYLNCQNQSSKDEIEKITEKFEVAADFSIMENLEKRHSRREKRAVAKGKRRDKAQLKDSQKRVAQMGRDPRANGRRGRKRGKYGNRSNNRRNNFHQPNVRPVGQDHFGSQGGESGSTAVVTSPYQRGTVNGIPVTLLFDTGASGSVVNGDKAQRLCTGGIQRYFPPRYAYGVGNQAEAINGWCEMRVTMLGRSAVAKVDVLNHQNPQDPLDAIMGVEVMGQMSPITVNLPKKGSIGQGRGQVVLKDSYTQASVNGRTISVLVDTGAQSSCINADVARQLCREIQPSNMGGVNGVGSNFVAVSGWCPLSVTLQTKTFSVRAIVLEQQTMGKTGLILGEDAIGAMSPIILRYEGHAKGGDFDIAGMGPLLLPLLLCVLLLGQQGMLIALPVLYLALKSKGMI